MSDSCYVCRQVFPPASQVLKLGANKFHPQCVKCATCQTSLKGVPFVEEAGKLYCEKCADSIPAGPAPAGPICKVCKKVIENRVTKAFSFTLHEACLKCNVCKKPLNDDGFYDDDTDTFLHLECS